MRVRVSARVYFISLSLSLQRPPSSPSFLPSLPPSSVPSLPFPLVITFITSIGCPHISYIFPHVQWSLAKEERPKEERGQRGREGEQETEQAIERPSPLSLPAG